MVCRLATKALTTYRSFRGADAAIDEKLVLVEHHWRKVQIKLLVLRKISDQLGRDLAQSQFNLLHKLQGKLLLATSLIESLKPKGRLSKKSALDFLKKLQYSLVLKNCLDELVVDLDKWQAQFDPTWYLTTRMRDIAIDSALAESRTEQATALGPKETTLDKMIALRHAINPDNRTLKGESGTQLSVNLPASGLHGATETSIPFSAARAIMRNGSTKLLIGETVDPLSGNISQVKVDVENLARRLKQIDPDAFGLLCCYGISRHLDATNRLLSIDMLYEAPEGSASPTSLRQLLLQQESVSVSAIIRLVKQLVRSVSYIHACDFVHKNIRPENVIVFPGKTSPLGSSFLLGFNQFRNTNFQTNLIGDPAWNRNLYRHPQRQGTCVQDRYVMQHDIYSLGVCMLEIGLWKPFVWYPKDGDGGAPVPGLALGLSLSDTQFQSIKSTMSLRIKEHLVELAERELPPRLGDKYTAIVLACLNCLDPGNEAFGPEQELADEDGILVGVRYIENVLIKMNEISI